MQAYKYMLEPYKGMNMRYNCPNCEKKEFARYIDSTTGKYIADHVGRCNREQSCGYNYTPSQYFNDNGIISEKQSNFSSINSKQVKAISFIPPSTFQRSLEGYEHNYFVDYLVKVFGTKITTKLIERYYIGCSMHWPGSVVFWQVDSKGKIRTGKIMLYSPETGKRRKDKTPDGQPYVTWVHSFLKLNEYNLSQCLFGEHLLAADKISPVAVVESEKTAIIASVYLPRFIWLACGGLSNLSGEKIKILKGRNVVLWPDLSCFDKWRALANEYGFKCYDFLEIKATDEAKKKGLDLADALIQWDYKDFIKLSELVPKTPQYIKQAVSKYWQGYPEAMKDFKVNSKDRHLYYEEFRKNNQMIDYNTFESYSIN
jgi:hypothetical protein